MEVHDGNDNYAVGFCRVQNAERESGKYAAADTLGESVPRPGVSRNRCDGFFQIIEECAPESPASCLIELCRFIHLLLGGREELGGQSRRELASRKTLSEGRLGSRFLR